MSKKKKEEKNKEALKKIQSVEHDIEYELEETEYEGVSQKDKLKKLRDELKAEKEKAHEYLTGWQTERASFANYKTQEEKKRQERLASMKLDLIADFLPVLDSFEMAFSNKEAWEKVDPAWRTGVEYIHTQLMKILEKYHVEVIDQVNIPFDPLIHEPTDTVPTQDEAQDHIIASIVQAGYKSGDKIIRPAKVKVYQFNKE